MTPEQLRLVEAMWRPRRRVILFNSAVNSTNRGDEVIVRSLLTELKDILRGHFVCEFAPFPVSGKLLRIASEAAVCIQAGTNLLTASMENVIACGQCVFQIKNLLLCGVGWGTYERRRPTAFTKNFYRRVLTNGWIHSVRDRYTAIKLSAYGVPVINTGCPSIWCLSKDYCARIPTASSDSVIFTLTKFRRSPEEDRNMIQILKERYRKLLFWPAQYEDGQYLRDLFGQDFYEVEPTLEAFDEILCGERVDYVGTRLHAGIRALQHGRRALIVGVDNRALEMGRDFGLPVLPRHEIGHRLRSMLDAGWRTAVTLDGQAIAVWKAQLSRILTEPAGGGGLGQR